MSDLQDIIQRWQNIDKFLDALLFSLCEQMVDVLQKNTPGTVFPTQWQFVLYRQTGKVIGEVFNVRLGSDTRAGYDPEFERIAFYLNDGTTPHWVEPVIAKALHWEEDGKDYFSKGHVVSEITPSHFKEKADRVIEEFETTIPRKFEDYINYGRLP